MAMYIMIKLEGFLSLRHTGLLVHFKHLDRLMVCNSVASTQGQ